MYSGQVEIVLRTTSLCYLQPDKTIILRCHQKTMDFQHFDELSDITTDGPYKTTKPTSGRVNNAHKLVHQILTFV